MFPLFCLLSKEAALEGETDAKQARQYLFSGVEIACLLDSLYLGLKNIGKHALVDNPHHEMQQLLDRLPAIFKVSVSFSRVQVCYFFSLIPRQV